MSLIDNIIRPDVRALSAYHVQDAAGCVKLDAMENPYQLPGPLRDELGRRLADVAMNRYPTPSYTALKAAICDRLGVTPEQAELRLRRAGLRELARPFDKARIRSPRGV